MKALRLHAFIFPGNSDPGMHNANALEVNHTVHCTAYIWRGNARTHKDIITSSQTNILLHQRNRLIKDNTVLNEIKGPERLKSHR